MTIIAPNPEMCIIYDKKQAVYFPSYFKQDSNGKGEESIIFDHSRIKD